jgi:hypothetical protein
VSWIGSLGIDGQSPTFNVPAFADGGQTHVDDRGLATRNTRGGNEAAQSVTHSPSAGLSACERPTFMKKFLPILPAALLMLAAALPGVASASTLPNQVAVASQDQLVALTFAGYPTRATLADAGDFSTTMIRDYGMIGIASFDPASRADSNLVCWEALPQSELIAAYGITGQGVAEATVICQSMSDAGYDVHWNN